MGLAVTAPADFEETDVIRRITSMIEQGNEWGDDLDIRNELAAAVDRTTRVRNSQPKE